jgi:AbrB family looped-hinge helix DNA binding protein
MSAVNTIDNVTTARLGEHGQMVIPENFREAFQLEPGDPIVILQLGNHLILIPEKSRFVELSESIAATLEKAGITEESLLEGLAETREEIARERYPELFSDSTEVAK